jgi:tetratricopeptide (TPR) repeat protein
MSKTILLYRCMVCFCYLMIVVSINAQDFPAIEKLSGQYPDSAYNLLKNYLNKAIVEKDAYGEAMCLQQMGQVLYHRGNYTAAIDHLMEAEKIFRENKYQLPLAQTLNYLGNIYYYNKQPQKANSEFAQALLLFKSLKDNKGLAETYGQIGHIYEKRLIYDSAYHFQKIALTYLTQENDKSLAAKIYENIGSIMEDRMQYDSALYYYTLSLQLNQSAENKIAQIEVINNLGDVHRKTGAYAKGLQYSKDAMLLSLEMQEKYQLSSAYRDIARSYELLQQYDSAYQYNELGRELLQEIYTTESSKQIAFMQALFDTEKKDAEITKLNAERRVNFIISISAIIVVLLLAMLAWVIYNRQRLKIKNERFISERNQQIYETRNGLLEAELKNKQLEEINLKQQLEIKSKELSSHILHLIQKNEVLETLRADLNELQKDDKRDQKKQIRKILQKINISFNQDSYWEEFRLIFDQVHQSFFTSLQELNADLSASELKLLALIKMNLSSQDIATLMGITPDSLRVTRYRIKKKLKLDPDESLTSLIQSF